MYIYYIGLLHHPKEKKEKKKIITADIQQSEIDCNH